jgi:hypothetical protein
MNARLSSAAKTQHNWKKTLREYEIIKHQFSQFPHQRSSKKLTLFFPPFFLFLISLVRNLLSEVRE